MQGYNIYKLSLKNKDKVKKNKPKVYLSKALDKVKMKVYSSN